MIIKFKLFENINNDIINNIRDKMYAMLKEKKKIGGNWENFYDKKLPFSKGEYEKFKYINFPKIFRKPESDQKNWLSWFKPQKKNICFNFTRYFIFYR